MIDEQMSVIFQLFVKFDLKVQCVGFRRSYENVYAETEYNIQNYVFIRI